MRGFFLALGKPADHNYGHQFSWLVLTVKQAQVLFNYKLQNYSTFRALILIYGLSRNQLN